MSKSEEICDVVEIIHYGGYFTPSTYEVLDKGIPASEARELCSLYASRVPPLGRGSVVYLPVHQNRNKNHFPC